MRIYYCSKCNAKKEVYTKDDMVCDCGHIFGTSYNISSYINMRNVPLSKTTKLELTPQTMQENISEMQANRRKR